MSKRTMTITIIDCDDDGLSIKNDVKGFTYHEVLGFLEIVKADIIEDMGDGYWDSKINIDKKDLS